jgi:hypothetical protein
VTIKRKMCVSAICEDGLRRDRLFPAGLRNESLGFNLREWGIRADFRVLWRKREVRGTPARGEVDGVQATLSNSESLG